MLKKIKERFLNLKIRVQLTVVVCAVLSILLFLAFTIAYFAVLSHHEKSILLDVENTLHVVSKGISRSLSENKYSDANDFLLLAVRNNNIFFAEFTDQKGMPVATSGSGRPDCFSEIQMDIKNLQTLEGADCKYMVSPLYSNGIFLGQLRLAVSPKSLEKLGKTSMLVLFIAFILIVSVTSSVFYFSFSLLFVNPTKEFLRKVSGIAQGDLSDDSLSDCRSEFSVISGEFIKMQNSMNDLIAKIRESHTQIRDSSKRILQVSGDISEGSSLQSKAFEEMSSATEEMNMSIKNIAENVDDLSTSSEETSSSILEMAATIEEVSEHTESLTSSVDETSSATEEMVFSIKEIDGNVEFLNNFISDTVASIEEMDVSIREVEKTAEESNEATNEVAEKAALGVKAVEKTIGGMVAIRDIVRVISDTITALGKRSSEIGKIVNVIEDIAEQTNLLSLNAAIIAAQAGDEGKGFAVVADEIRGLAERTSTSTKDISDLIDAVQKGTSEAVKSMIEGTKSVDEGVKLSKQAGNGLREILRSAQFSSTKSKDIARTTREQAVSSKAIRNSVEQVKDMTEQIRKATSEQTRGSEVIMSSMDRMREMTNQVKRATIEQHQGSQLITEAIESITDKVGHIQKATTHHAQGSEMMLASLMGLKSMLDANNSCVDKINEAVAVLNEHAEILEKQIRQFRTS